MKKLIILFTLLSTNLVYASPNNDTIKTPAIVSATIKGLPQCLKYKVIGLCFWYEDFSINRTLMLDHYMPDSVVSVFTKPNNNPWWFLNKTLDPIMLKAGKMEIKKATDTALGFGDSHNNSARDMNNHFHETDIIGNPALSLLGNFNLLLRSPATPYMPYYSSLLDAYAWRFPALDKYLPGSHIPGLHEVGTLVLHDWGPVYPRNGMVNQPDDAKAAAVNAERASDIITKIAQPHLYQPLFNSCGDHCKIDPVKENDPHTQFQLIYPKVETSCQVFGNSDADSAKPWESDAAKQGDHRYIWILWRHYHGCVQGGGEFVGSMNF